MLVQSLYMAGGSESRDRHSSLSTSQSACDSRPETAIVSAICRGSKAEEEEKIPAWSPRRFNLIQNTSRSSRGPRQVAHPAITAERMQRGLVFNLVKWPGHSSTYTTALKCPTATQLAPKRVCNGAWPRAAATRAPIGWWARAAANVTKKQKKASCAKKEK